MLAIFVLLVSGVLAVRYWNTLEDKQIAEDKDFIEEFDTAAIDRVEILGGDQDVDLKKVEGNWVLASVDDSPADGDAVVRLISDINYATTQYVVSETGSNKEKYGLTEEERYTVTLYTGDLEVHKFYFGSSGSSFRTAYAMCASNEKIHLIDLHAQSYSREDWLAPPEEEVEEGESDEEETEEETEEEDLADDGTDETESEEGATEDSTEEEAEVVEESAE